MENLNGMFYPAEAEGQETLYYPEETLTASEEREQAANLDLMYAGLVVDVPNIDQLPNEEYAMLRKNGLGTSDSSSLLGVNPYKSRAELIKDKTTMYLTEEDKAVGEQTAVRKGNDLEPLIIEKFQRFFKQETWKPSDMYRHSDYPYLKFNFDGITGSPGKYIPAEIKVVTSRGEKHYNPTKAMFNELEGFKPLQMDVSNSNNSIATKAAHYGIPPYYYTQLQQQIFGTGAEFGYLSVLFEKDWRMYTFLIYRDKTVINDLIVEGFKLWEKVKQIRGDI